MLILGLLLIAVAVAAATGALFLLDGDVTYFGVDMSASTLFLLGAGTVALLVLGLKLSRFGAKRGLRQRREHKRLARLSDKLDRADQERTTEEG